MLTIGFLINPYAGLGGPLALKGSDDIDVSQHVSAGQDTSAMIRARIVLSALVDNKHQIRWLTAPSVMGETLLRGCGFDCTVVGELDHALTSADDSERLCHQLASQNIDLLLFVGGDGTARNVVNGLQAAKCPEQLSLGIPAGVKMHSGVYTVSPQAATRVIELLLQREPVSTATQEVRDIDEQALRQGQLNTCYYGELVVPNDDRYVQQVKNTGREDETTLQLDIVAGMVDDINHDSLYIIGPGTTPKAIMDELGLANTLLGVDVLLGRELIASDVNAIELEALLERYPYHQVMLFITAIAGQGHILGRGNQQLSPKVLRRAGKQNTRVLVTPSKLAELQRRPLLIDSGDTDLDQEWSGLLTLYTGYRQTAVYSLTFGG